MTAIVAVSALMVSGLGFYRSYIYTKQQLDVTVTEVSYVTNRGELYMTVAFSNGGNRDAALLRAEPALWSHDGKSESRMGPAGRQGAPEHPGDRTEDADDCQSGRDRGRDAVDEVGCR